MGCRRHGGEDNVGACLHKCGGPLRARRRKNGALLSFCPHDNMRFLLSLECPKSGSSRVEDPYCSGLWKDDSEKLSVSVDPHLSTSAYREEEAIARVHRPADVAISQAPVHVGVGAGN